MKRFAEVDTSAIPLVLSRGTDFQNSLEHLTVLEGAATLAAWSLKEPEKLVLARLGHNDLYLVLDAARHILYYTSAAVGARILPKIELHTLPFLTMTKLPDDRIMVLSPGEPFNSRVLVAERKPFFRYAGGRPAHNTTVFSTPAKDGTKTTPETTPRFGDKTSSRHGKLQWNRQPNAPYPEKPGPVLVAPARFEWGQFERSNIVKLSGQLDKHGTRVLETFYGRWILAKDKNGQVVTRFKPIKSVKKYWKRHFDTPVLPMATTPGTRLDHMMTLERVNVSQPLGDNGLLEKGGYVCPWCGGWAMYSTWNTDRGRCCMCGVASRFTSLELPT